MTAYELKTQDLDDYALYTIASKWEAEVMARFPKHPKESREYNNTLTLTHQGKTVGQIESRLYYDARRQGWRGHLKTPAVSQLSI